MFGLFVSILVLLLIKLGTLPKFDGLVKSLLERHPGESRGPEQLEITIGVGTPHWFAAPLPPNRTGGSPASGSPVGGLTSERTGVESDEPPQG